MVGALTTKSMKYSHSARHRFSAQELLFAHGWPALPEHSRGRQMPFVVENFSAAQLSRFLGNGMHIGSVAAWLCYCLSHVKRRSSVELVGSLAQELLQQHDGSDAEPDTA